MLTESDLRIRMLKQIQYYKLCKGEFYEKENRKGFLI